MSGKTIKQCCVKINVCLEKCTNCLFKFALLIFSALNVVFLLLGLCVVVGTTVMLVNFADWLELARQQQNTVVLLLMGLFIFVVAALGLFGARIMHKRGKNSIGNTDNHLRAILSVYGLIMLILAIAVLCMAIGMDYFMKHLNDKSARTNGNPLQSSFQHCDRYAACSFEYCCDGQGGRAIAGHNVTCYGQVRSTVYAMGKGKICGTLQDRNLVGDSSCVDYETYERRVYEWVQEKFKPIITLTIAVGLVLTATFAFCIITFLCKLGRKCCDYCHRCDCCSNEKSPKDHNLTADEETTRELVNTIMKSDSAEMAYIEKCGYSSVSI